MRKLAFAFVALAFAPVWADTVYTEEGAMLVATVTAAETNEFDSTYATKLNANEYTSFEKRGDGGLFMPADLSGYMGTVTVRNGTLGYRKSTSLGSLSAGNGAVEVIAGATLFIPDNNTDSGVTANSISPIGKSFRLAGLGVGDLGAVNIRSEQQKCPMGTNITLTADTRVRNRTQYFWGNAWNSVTHRCQVDMGGNTLRLYSEGSSPIFKMVDVVNPGNVVIEYNNMGITDTEFGGTSANEFRIESDVRDTALTVPGNVDYHRPWTLVAGYGMGIFAETQGWDPICNSHPGVTTNYNVWHGPVALRGSRQVNVQSGTSWHGGLTFLGKVSGSAPLRVWGNRADDGSKFHHPYLNLVCPENDFTGEFVLRYGGVRLWNPGAIGAPSQVKMEGGEVAFDNLCDDFGTLPDLNADCGLSVWSGHPTIPYTNEVRFGRGEWKSVTKTGDELLWWYSGTGAKELNVQGGFVKMPRRAKIAGLYSAQTNSYSSTDIKDLFTAGSRGMDWCHQRDLEAGVRAPNDKTHAYNNYSYKLDPSRSGDAQWSTVIYSGYVWNNSKTNETWSFAGGGGYCYRLTIGDTVVYDIADHGSGGSTLGHGNAVLKPGPNFFELASYRRTRVDGYSTWNSNWKNELFNFGYDPSGRDTGVQSDYRRMEDPGDGSLFTFCLPDEVIVYPRHEGETHTSTQPDFAHITFADGSGLDLDGVTNYVAASFTGWPVITNATCFAVTNRWTLRVADLGTKFMATDGTLDLSCATIDFDNAALLPMFGDIVYRIAEAKGGIEGLPSVETGLFGRRYDARLSSDGKALEIVRIPLGTKIYFR